MCRATKFGAACPQLPAGWLPYIGWNEDCLYLNVWTTHLSESPKLPVIVYFHGGTGYSQLNRLVPRFLVWALLWSVPIIARWDSSPIQRLRRSRHITLPEIMACSIREGRVKVSRETLRRWMVEDGLWLSRKQRRSFHRRACGLKPTAS
jgi:hypothetical protein